jgi:hypothetical protein
MTRERTEVELGFDGGGVVRCTLDAGEALSLEHAFREGGARLVALAADGGPLVVDLARIVYVRALAQRPPLGFGEA